jgi:hypothetical protein
MPGQLTHAASVGLLHHLAPIMDAALKKLEGDPAAAPGSAANKGSQLLYRDCVDTTGDAEAAHKLLSDTTVKTWLEGYRTVMQGIHGKKASTLKNLTPGTTIETFIVPMNEGGAGPASPTISKVVGA